MGLISGSYFALAARTIPSMRMKLQSFIFFKKQRENDLAFNYFFVLAKKIHKLLHNVYKGTVGLKLTLKAISLDLR